MGLFFFVRHLIAMEAEYVRAYVDKSQYKSSDPNNTFWAKDQSRFGLKMLKNMGWSEGRGLGANEDGTVAHIPIKKKVTNAGIGETNNSSDNWLQGAFEFNNILKRLNSSQNEQKAQTETKSSKKNNSSKKRHMYQNRLASRDASAYSKEDLELILGTKKLQKTEEIEEEVFSESEEEDQFLTTRKVSVMDYFLKKGTASDETEVFETKDRVYEEGTFGGSGLGFGGAGKKRSREELNTTSGESEDEPKAKKSKKAKKEKKKSKESSKKSKKKSEKSKSKKSKSSSKREKSKSKKSKKSSKEKRNKSKHS